MKTPVCILVALCFVGSFGDLRARRQAGPAVPPAPTKPPMAPPAPTKGTQSPTDASTTKGPINFPTPPKPTGPPVQDSTPSDMTSSPSSTATRGPTMAPSDDCLDQISDCRLYGVKGCVGIYESWAKYNCPRYCGFCVNPNDTKIECKDAIPNCNEYGSDTCTETKYRIFAEDNCRKTCNLCDSNIRAGGQMTGAGESPVLLDAAGTNTSTSAGAGCADTVDYCWTEPDANCFGIYEPWSQTHCPFRCGFCDAKPKCEDELTYCSQYDQSACVDDAFIGWARKNCRKTCNLCQLPVRPSTDAPPAGGTGTPVMTTSGTGSSNSGNGGTGTMAPGAVTPDPSPSSQSVLSPNKTGSVSSGPDGNFLRGIKNTFIIQGPPAVLPDTCLYKGQSYLQDINWYDGCDYICNCLDAKNNRIICVDQCTKWESNLPIGGCSWVREAGECCERLECTDQ